MTDIRRDDVCVTCADELTRFLVEAVSADGRTATGSTDGVAREVALDLVDAVRAGDVLLVHGGVALQRAPDIPSGERDAAEEAGRA